MSYSRTSNGQGRGPYTVLGTINLLLLIEEVLLNDGSVIVYAGKILIEYNTVHVSKCGQVVVKGTVLKAYHLHAIPSFKVNLERLVLFLRKGEQRRVHARP